MHSRHARRTHAHLDDAAATVRRSLGVCAALLSRVNLSPAPHFLASRVIHGKKMRV